MRLQIKVINLFVSARLNRDVKQTLELDWSDKQQAYSLDDQCGHYNNRSTDTQSHPSSAVLQDQCVSNLRDTNCFSIRKVLGCIGLLIMHSYWQHRCRHSLMLFSVGCVMRRCGVSLLGITCGWRRERRWRARPWGGCLSGCCRRRLRTCGRSVPLWIRHSSSAAWNWARPKHSWSCTWDRQYTPIHVFRLYTVKK